MARLVPPRPRTSAPSPLFHVESLTMAAGGLAGWAKRTQGYIAAYLSNRSHPDS